MRLILALLQTTLLLAQESPAFFCFVKPTDANPLELKEIGATTCTHFVYGDVPADDGKLKYRPFDLLANGREGLIRQFLRLRQTQKDAKFLLGVRRAKPLRNSVEARDLSDTINSETESKNFDGVFLTFDGHQMDDVHAQTLLERLAEKKELLPPTVSLTAQKIWQGRDMERLRMTLDNVQYLYLDMSTVLSNEDPFAVTQIDVINATKGVFAEDTIQGTLSRLGEAGIQEAQVIVGLTSGGWQFDVDERNPKAAFSTTRGVRVSYQKACKQRGSMRFDKETMNEVKVYKNSWTVTNHPHPNGLGKKIEYLVSKGVAGIGLSSFQDDDLKGVCGTDPLPNHRFAAEFLHKGMSSKTSQCSRICYLDAMVGNSFPFDSLKSHFCSHVVVSNFDLDLKDTLIVPRETNILLQRVGLWRAKMESPPKLILSIGSQQKNDIWSFMLSNAMSRSLLINDLVELVKREDADGVELSFTREGPKGDFDTRNLETLMVELAKKTTVFAAVTPEATLANFYNMTLFNQTTTMVVVHTHRLHSEANPMTGHQSSFSVSATSVAGNNVKDVIKKWIDGGVKRNKIAMSVSAKALSMKALGVSKSAADLFGRPIVSKLKALPNEIDSQQKICEALLTGSTEQWVPQLDVPYLLHGDEFVTYDNKKSMRIKTRWASVEGIAIAVHDLSHDDPFSLCAEKRPFPILNEVVKNQVCRKCIYHGDFISCRHDFAVSCSFELEKSSPIFKTNIIPIELCTEVVVEHAKLNASGSIEFNDEYEEQVVQNITEMRSQMLKCGTILTIKSFISDRLFSKLLLENRASTINNIVEYVEKNNFTGVNLDLENVIKRSNNVHFNNFLSELMTRISSTKADNGCDRTVSIRFGATSHAQSSVYRMSTLNRLHRISIGITDNKIDKALLATDGADVSADEIIRKWTRRGLKASKILLEMSPFGYLDAELGEPYSQGNICELVGNKAPKVYNYDTMMATVRRGSDPLYLPNSDTFAYKMGYAQREGLGGVSIKSVNGDDYNGLCGIGSFPVLKAIYECH